MGRFEETERAFEKFFRMELLADHRDLAREALIKELDIEPNHVVVEIGVGDGRLALPIAEHLDVLGGEGIVLSLDRSSSSLEDLAAREVLASGLEGVRLINLPGCAWAMRARKPREAARPA
jgi:ubiquinone/menaquinone biosynthesis C-methylase UbiE